MSTDNTKNSTTHLTDIVTEDPGHFLEESVDALHIISPQGIIIWANRAELELLGYTSEEYIGHHISEFYTDSFVINDILCRLIYNQEVINYPAELIRKDGSKIQILLNSNVYAKDGHFIHTRSSLRDVSDFKLFQTRIETSNAQMLNQLLSANTIIELICNATWHTDYRGHITSLQDKWQTYTGQNLEEQLNYGWLKAIHPDDRLAFRANLIDAIKANSNFKQLTRVFCQENKEHYACGIYGVPTLSVNSHDFQWSFVLIDKRKVTS